MKTSWRYSVHADADDHIADGFRGGSNRNADAEIPKDEDTESDLDDDVTAA